MFKTPIICLGLLCLKGEVLWAQYAKRIVHWRWENYQFKETKNSMIEHFNEDSLIVSKEFSDGSRTTFTYNRNNLLTEINESGVDRTIYKYNENNQKSVEEQYVYDRLTKRIFFEYNDNGVLKKSYYGMRDKGDDSSIISDYYFYDQKNQLIQKKKSVHYVNVPRRESEEITTYSYKNTDTTLTVTELTFSGGKSKVWKKVTVYNDKGWILKQTEKNRRLEYTYQLNSIGDDWLIKKTCLKEGAGLWNCFQERKIVLPNH